MYRGHFYPRDVCFGDVGTRVRFYDCFVSVNLRLLLLACLRLFKRQPDSCKIRLPRSFNHSESFQIEGL